MGWGVVANAVFFVVGWAGFVLVGIAILMALLDWGELSGLDPQPSRGHLSARTVAICGLVLGVVGLVGSFLT